MIVEPDKQNGLDKTSLIRVPDVTTFDKGRLKKRVGILKAGALKEVEACLKLHLGL